MLKSRTQWPPGGWKFRQQQTNWTLPPGLDFDTAVRAIVNHRKANQQHRLSLDRDVVANELDDYTCRRLKNHPSYCVDATAASFSVPLPRRSHRVGVNDGVAGGKRYLQNASAGIKLWIDWFGEGRPVDRAIAEDRAVICSRCDQNDKNLSLVQRFTQMAVREIKAIFSALNDLDMHTSKDDELVVCRACDCPLKAKVWAPLHIIKKHLSEEAFGRLDSQCWIRHEPDITSCSAPSQSTAATSQDS